MPDEPASERTPSELATSQVAFDRCLVHSDRAADPAGRVRRRKALGLSLILETLLLTAVVLAPLTGTVAKLPPPTGDYFPVAAWGPRRMDQNARPTRGDQRPATTYDRRPVFPIPGKPYRPEPPVADGSGEVSPSIGDVVPGLLGYGNAIFMDLRPTTPAAPPEEIKKNTERRPLKLSEPIVQAQLISRVEPRYPLLAVQIHLQGTVRLHAIISLDGRITSLEVVSGHPLLVQAALEAVRQWRYRPTMLNGEPVEVETTISVIFHLQN